MAQPTTNQRFHLIMADIAMAASIQVHDPDYQWAADAYAPGSLRDAWLGQVTDKLLSMRVTSMANAAMGALLKEGADKVVETAARHRIPVDAALAAEMVEHFQNKRDAVLTYRR